MASGAPIARQPCPPAGERGPTGMVVGRQRACRTLRIGRAFIASLGIAALAACQIGPATRAGRFAATAEDAEARFLSALTGDIGALELLLADDFLYATSEGTVLGKTALLEHLRSGVTRVERITAEELGKLRHEGVVVTMGHLAVEARHEGKSFQVRSRYVHVWIETADGWQLLARESDVPAPRPR